jgi:hypothetical protein
MSCAITVAPGNTHILMIVTGEITRALALKYNTEAHRMAAPLGITRYLMDLTSCVNTDTVTSNYEFAHQDMKHLPGIDRAAVVAVVTNPHDDSHDFIRTVTRNAGFNVTFFTDRAAAQAFLLSEPA